MATLHCLPGNNHPVVCAGICAVPKKRDQDVKVFGVVISEMDNDSKSIPISHVYFNRKLTFVTWYFSILYHFIYFLP